MKPFTFTLQAVWTMRQRQEQLALAAFGEAVRARQAAVEEQHRAGRQLAAAFDQLTTRQSEGAPVYHLNQLRRHCQVLEQRLAGRQADCVRAQEAANAAWERLQDIRQALELLNKLHRRQRDQYERELRAAEQKLLDEMTGRRWLPGTATGQPASLAWN